MNCEPVVAVEILSGGLFLVYVGTTEIIKGVGTMAFIRAKKIKNRIYYYEVENTWVGGKVRQKVLRYFGKIKPPPSA